MNLKEELEFLKSAAHSYGSINAPSECIMLISRGKPYDQLFFNEITDPRWLPLLARENYYSVLPEPKLQRDGTLTYPPHIPLDGLTKLAKIAPKEVVEVLEKLKIPKNPTVMDQVMRVIVAVKDASLAARLVPVLQQILESSSNSEWIWLEDILVNWLRHGESKSCFAIIQTCFTSAVSLSETQKHGHSDWYLGEIDQKIISPLGDQQPLEMARFMWGILVSWAKSERSRIARDKNYYTQEYDPENDPDYDHPPTYWLEQFGAPAIGEHHLESIAANRLYAIGRKVYGSGKSEGIEVLEKMLREDRWHLFRRLRWQLYTDCPKTTLEFARRDILERMPRLGQRPETHEYELAQMLKTHAETHGNKFLSDGEVTSFCKYVFDGDKDIDPGEKAAWDRFYVRQLLPIASLLKGDDLAKFKSLSKGEEKFDENAYKPFSTAGGGGTVCSVSPRDSVALGQMSDDELWTFINTWVPCKELYFKDRIEEETIVALGESFADLLETTPQRFLPETEWWKHISRGAVLCAPLERAIKRFDKIKADQANAQSLAPREVEWKNWFGLASYIAAQKQPSAPSPAEGAASSEPDEWSWPKITVARFLEKALQAGIEVPEQFWPHEGSIFKALVQSPDPRLRDSSGPLMGQWVTRGINSVRGTAIGGILQLGLSQKQRSTAKMAESWIFDVIEERLRAPEESPAIFAVLGSRCRLMLFLFPEQVKSNPQLVLPDDRPEHRKAFVVSHILYDNPASYIFQCLPGLHTCALDYLQETMESKGQGSDPYREFGSRLGTHLCFYYWNNAAGSPDAEVGGDLKRFFELADSNTRAATIKEVARIFRASPLEQTPSDLCKRVINLWDWRLITIDAAIRSTPDMKLEFSEELSDFLEWVACSYFPFEWRYERAIKTIDSLDKAPRVYFLMDSLEKEAADPAKLYSVLEILCALLSKPFGEFRWSVRKAALKSILGMGLGSSDEKTRQLVEKIQEKLLKEGLFEYLDIPIKTSMAK